MNSFELKLIGAQFSTFDGSARFMYIPLVNSVNVTKNEDIFTGKNLPFYETVLCCSWYLKDGCYEKYPTFLSGGIIGYHYG